MKNLYLQELEGLKQGNYFTWINSTAICLAEIPNIVLVKFQAATKVATVISKEPRVSLSDYISNFGILPVELLRISFSWRFFQVELLDSSPESAF